MTNRNGPNDVTVQYVEYPHDGRHVVTLYLAPLPTDDIHPFADWVLSRLDAYLKNVFEVKVELGGRVRLSFYRNEVGGVTAGTTAFSRVDREKFEHVLTPRNLTMATAVATVIRLDNGRHVGTKVVLKRAGGESFDTEIEDEVAALSVVADVELERETCGFTMAVPAVNNRRGTITDAIKHVAEVLRCEVGTEDLVVIDPDPDLAMLPEFAYRNDAPPATGG